MHRLIVTMTLLMFGGIAALCADMAPTLTVDEATKLVTDQPHAAATTQIISQMIERIDREAASSIDDEIAFLVSVERFDIAESTALKHTTALLMVLEKKYKDTPDSLMRLLLHELVLYRNTAPNPAKLADVVTRVAVLNRDIQSNQAVMHLTQLVELGDAYRALPGGDGVGEERNKARECYAQVVAFTIFHPAYESRYDALKQVYVRAALGLVDATNGPALKQLHFYPFAYDEIARVFPQKAKSISRAFPGTAAANDIVATWLRAAIRDADEGSQLRKNLEAVLAYQQGDQK